MRSWLIAGLLASLVITAGLWFLGLPGLFLFLPFLPFAFWSKRTPATRCPQCGRQADPSDRYCRHDGTRL